MSATRAHRCTRPAGAVQIGRLRPINPAEGNLGNYPWPPGQVLRYDLPNLRLAMSALPGFKG